MNLEVWTPEDLLSFSLKSETEIAGSLYSSSASLGRNWSISFSNEWSEKDVSSLGVSASGGTHWKGNFSSATSFEAKNPSFITSIRAKRQSPVLIELPVY